jgi:ATP-binding cassette subfamily B protein
MVQSGEFSIKDAYRYDQRSPLRWILSHVWRYKLFLILSVGCFIGGWVSYSSAQRMIGTAANAALQPDAGATPIIWLALSILGLLALDGLFNLTGSISAENIAARFEADARQELYASLLSKSQAFHDRQRAGDMMARATDDTQRLSDMIVPGSTLLFETILGIVIPLSFIGSVKPELLAVPLGFVACYIVAVVRYRRRLAPIIRRQRDQFGLMNAGLEETISGIEVVKASAREMLERVKFRNNAARFRDLFVMQGRTEARYLPLLLYGIAVGLTFLHTMLLYQAGRITIGEIISVMALMAVLRFPTFISIFSLSLVQAGLASAARILTIIKAETDLHENASGHRVPLQGAITFEHVNFSYGNTPVLRDVSFHVAAGQTVAIVGQTGSGKSALTQLVNRTYDTNSGRVLVDSIDVRAWSLDALRSQISKIEQDVFLFSRSIRDNIAFGRPSASQTEVEAAARAAQAHDFIMKLPDGYDTVVGERGTTLSGGQRQRVALARAFLSDPRVLILDDSTSAIDSATEDEIQRAIRQAQQGRTTLLITHRLSQIRWADLILVIDKGQLVAQGTHEDLLRTSVPYRRIFARYDAELPELEESGVRSQESAGVPA